MRKITVITQKELVNPELLTGSNTIVLDIFLATSTVIQLVYQQYQPVITTRNAKEAIEIHQHWHSSATMFGEKDGNSINGFEFPDPTIIPRTSNNNPAIICSTNGTKAVDLCQSASGLWVSSLTNGHYVAKEINALEDNRSIVLVCAGNDGRFSLEDLVGAGQIINELSILGTYQFSDSAKLAKSIYLLSKEQNFANLLETETSDLLRIKGYENAMNFVINHEKSINIAPKLTNRGFE